MKTLINEFKKDARYILINCKKHFNNFEKSLEKFADKVL